MFTQRLILLCLLAAVAGGCSIWYTTKILPAKMAADDVSQEVESMPTTESAPVETETKTAAQGTVPTPTVTPTAGTQTTSADTSIDADISAIAADADSSAGYDDSSVEAGITGGATSVTNAYGI